MVAQVQVQAEELGKQAWEGEEIHLQQMLKVFFGFFLLFHCFILRKIIPQWTLGTSGKIQYNNSATNSTLTKIIMLSFY